MLAFDLSNVGGFMDSSSHAVGNYITNRKYSHLTLPEKQLLSDNNIIYLQCMSYCPITCVVGLKQNELSFPSAEMPPSFCSREGWSFFYDIET